MAIFFSYKTPYISKRISNKNNLKKWITYIIEKEFKKSVGDINFYFTDDSEILEINKKYLAHNYYTDIITFNYCTENSISGDIVISVDTVKSNAKDYNLIFENELHRVIIHGILHLLGFDDSTEEQKKEIREKENWALKIFYSKWN
ncbi:rRNA maturation RNase YbeY [Tenuifilum osseticum]|uniref:rRNA maturation RNase YbeY n=1 Tax=Tenuifilum osseticum TaxID=3374723 RepID=UPI0034E5BD30